MSDEYFFTLIDRENSPEAEIILENLRDYNNSKVDPANAKPLVLAVRNNEGKVVAGLKGETSRGWLFVELFWIDEKLRKSGLGSKILTQAETEAKGRGCDFSYLDTFSFQALGFYEKCGYKKFGELDNFPKGHQRYFLYKAL